MILNEFERSLFFAEEIFYCSKSSQFAIVKFANSLDICFSEKNVSSLNIIGVVCYFPELNFF